MAIQHSGRLELTWTNKHLRLLADGEGKYTWVPPTDYRVAEVRLLHGAGVVGEVAESRADGNLLIRGDALNALTSLIELPEFAAKCVGRVKLAYLDPPFNTQQSFLQYDDALEHSVWLTMMRDRLLQIRRLLAPGGSVWVHCDDSEQARLRIVMDEVFGVDAHIATIIWKKRNNLPNDRPVAANHDYIHVYGDEANFNLRPRPEGHGGYTNPDNDPDGPWALHPIDANAKGGRHVDHLVYPITNPNTGEDYYPPEGRNWAYSREDVETMIAEGRIIFGKTGKAAPKKKAYLKDVRSGLTWPTMWLDDSYDDFPVNNDADQHIQQLFGANKRFETPKPEGLMQRIIAMGTDPGDIVLDCFLGSGSTASTAHKMGRRWIGVEISADTLETFTVPRMTRVVEGHDPRGITEDISWEGGGGFRILDVAPSMFEEVDDTVLLAPWAVDGDLHEAVAAQLGFSFEQDPPYCGRKSRVRLAVVDGLVNPDVVDLLVEGLAENEQMTICATALDPGARERLREKSPGSTLRKIPSSLLAEYRVRRRFVPSRGQARIEQASEAGVS